jgi:predicted metal-binding membrane protein
VDGALEALLRRDRVIVAAAIALVAALAWTYLLSGAGMGASGLEMTAMSGWWPGSAMAMPSPPWTLSYGLIVFAMWWVMMIGMMLPSAAPVLLIHAAYGRRRRGASTAIFAAGYLAIWSAASLGAALLQWALTRAGVMDGMMQVSNGVVAGLLLIAAGLYQLTPAKAACLGHCQAPFAFLQRHSRPGRLGAFRMGVEHGLYCLGCCWGLMLLLFVGGAMNLVWVALLALLVLIEKLVRLRWLGQMIGAVLCLGGLALVAGA